MLTESEVVVTGSFFLKDWFYCSEMYKRLHEILFIKTVPDTSLHENSDLT